LTTVRKEINKMKIKILSIILLVLIIVIITKKDPSALRAYVMNDGQKQEAETDDPNVERKFFEYWHEPYGNVLEQDMMTRIWQDVKRLPNETSLHQLPVNSWSMIGPYGLNGSGFAYTGRILDIEAPVGSTSGRIAAASGGIWQYVFSIPFGIMNSATSQASSTLATNPTNANIIFVGTGEETQRAGTGLWRTLDQGNTWSSVPMSPTPNTFYRIRYTPGNVNRMHAAANVGYYRSDDGGATWTRKFTGNITDLAINPSNTAEMYIAKWGDATTGGIYKSTNSGDNWTKLTTNIPSSNVGRSALTICASSPNIVYTLLTRYDNNAVLGIYKSGNSGSSWARFSLTDTLLGGNGWYNCIIGASPTDPNIVLAGMTNLLRTTNGGSLWAVINTPAVHADQHAITWESNGTTVFAGNDGGLSTSTNSGASWNTSGNSFAITQFYNFDVGISNTNVRFGGSQDNGISGTTTGGTSWNFTLGGDGGGVLIDRFNAATIFAINGAYGGNNLFFRQKSGNSGQSWSAFNGGILDDSDWAPVIRRDNTNPDNLYTNADNFVYVCSSPYTTWTKLNTTGFPLQVANITVRGFPLTVFACLQNSFTNSAKLRVYDGGTWFERSTGLPSSTSVRTVTIGAGGINGITYALMNGLGTPTQKIFKSTDRGVSWINITGDFPNVPISGLIQNPTTNTTLYVGSEFGF